MVKASGEKSFRKDHLWSSKDFGKTMSQQEPHRFREMFGEYTMSLASTDVYVVLTSDINISHFFKPSYVIWNVLIAIFNLLAAFKVKKRRNEDFADMKNENREYFLNIH
ncbi:hypothetical protein CapIbe_011403 [Capra ibex]